VTIGKRHFAALKILPDLVRDHRFHDSRLNGSLSRWVPGEEDIADITDYDRVFFVF